MNYNFDFLINLIHHAKLISRIIINIFRDGRIYAGSFQIRSFVQSDLLLIESHFKKLFVPFSFFLSLFLIGRIKNYSQEDKGYYFTCYCIPSRIRFPKGNEALISCD